MWVCTIADNRMIDFCFISFHSFIPFSPFISFPCPFLESGEQNSSTELGMGVCVRLHPCHEGAVLRKSFRKQPSFMLTRGELGRTNNKKGQVKARAFRLQQCVFVSFLKALPSPHFSFYSLSGLRSSGCFPTRGRHRNGCLSCDLAMTVGFWALSIPKRGKRVSSRM